MIIMTTKIEEGMQIVLITTFVTQSLPTNEHFIQIKLSTNKNGTTLIELDESFI